MALHEVTCDGAWLYGEHRTCAVTAAVSRAWQQSRNNQSCKYVHHFGGYSKHAIESYIHSFRITRDKSAVSLLQDGAI